MYMYLSLIQRLMIATSLMAADSRRGLAVVTAQGAQYTVTDPLTPLPPLEPAGLDIRPARHKASALGDGGPPTDDLLQTLLDKLAVLAYNL